MSVRATFDVRRIVEQARELTAVPMPGREHPVGLHLRDHYFLRPNEGQPRVRLPKRAAGLTQIQEILSRDVLGLDQSESRIAWNILLDQPSLCAPVRPPTVTELLESGFAISEDEGSFVRAVALAAVYRRGEREEQVAGRATAEVSARFAGVGRLIVVTEVKNPEVSVNAWADVKWVLSGTALCRELEVLYENATPSTQRSGTRKSIALLLGDDLADRLPDGSDARLSVIAAIHGFNLHILRRPRRHTGTVLGHIRTTPPSLLVIAAPQDAKIEAIIKTYRATGVVPNVYQLGDCAPDELTDFLREVMGAVSGINPGLFLSEPFDHPESRDVSGVGVPVESELTIPGIWPVQKAGRELIHGAFGKFVENISDGFWYTRDKAHHAESKVKRYRRNGRLLEHDADIDASGVIITKHKGVVGAVVSLDDMRGV